MTSKKRAEAIDNCCKELFQWYISINPTMYNNSLTQGFSSGTYTERVKDKVNELSAKYGISSNAITQIVAR